MFSLNRAQIIGNVTRDPEMRYTPNGQAVCSFGVATNRRWRDKDGNNQEQTEFHNVVCWQKVAEIISQYVKKGNRIYIEGRLQTRQWEGQDGTKRNRTEIVMEDFVFLTPKGTGRTESSAPTDAGEGVEEFPSSAKATEGKPVKDEKPSKKEVKKEEKPAKEEDSAKRGLADSEEIDLDDIPF
jgi:single-strand DNA-binding protein